MKIGIAGTGAMAQEILPLLRDWDWEVTALCGTQRSKDRTIKICRWYNIEGVYWDYDTMLEQADMDVLYIAVPNHLHCSFAIKAMEKGYHVIIEKPIASNYREAQQMADMARKKNLFLFEAITTVNLPNYHKIKELLTRIGDIKAVNCNFSQYSHRYDAFLAGETAPVFDPAKSGGALMDINLYNLYYVLGLFGEPKEIRYYANMERGIDTSGTLLMEYNTFCAVCIGAKDSASPCGCVIQGTKGYICQNTPANSCGELTLQFHDGTKESYDLNPKESRLKPEFQIFAKEIVSGDTSRCYQMLERSLLVSRIQTQVRLEAGIRFPADV